MEIRLRDNMNTDVLSNIAKYCDIDSRRALGPEFVRPLVRNADFDVKLQAIHRWMMSNRHYSEYNGNCKKWKIQMNHAHSIDIMIWHKVHNKHVHSVRHTFCYNNNNNTDMYRTACFAFNTSDDIEEITSQVGHYRGNYPVFSYFRNGRWEIYSGGRTDKALVPLKKLGYVIVS
jgi:hypothetical protein